jgi:tRNA G18 (ribose-2'-O)-methylase SpoU
LALPIEHDRAAASASGDVTLVIYPDVQDPENLGSIVRTATALGVTALALGPRRATRFRVLRASMGAAFKVPIFECPHLADEMTAFRRRLATNPILPGVGSSNVAVTAGTVLYQLVALKRGEFWPAGD